MRESDNKKKETVQAKNDAETLGYQVEKQLTDLKTKLEALRAYMTQDDAELDDLKEKTKDLQELSWKVTQEVCQQGDSSGDAGGEEKQEEKKEDDKKEEEKKEKK